jgi:curved DNA-binding protein
MQYQDYYKTLGVNKDADQKEIKKAFRKLARESHPDLHPGDKAAEERFKLLNEAHEVLSDPDKRQKYDQFGSQWKQYDQMGGGNMNDFFRQYAGGQGGQQVNLDDLLRGMGGAGSSGHSSFFDILFGQGGGNPFGGQSGFGGQPRQARVEAEASITLEEAFHGTTRLLQRSDGSQIEAKIPAGVKSGSKIRLGDIYLKITVKKHPLFEREGDNLHVTVDMDLFTAVLGGKLAVPTLAQPLNLTIPAGTSSGKRIRLKGQGMPKLKSKGERGDLYVTVQVTVPKALSDKERALFEELRTLRLEE